MFSGIPDAHRQPRNLRVMSDLKCIWVFWLQCIAILGQSMQREKFEQMKICDNQDPKQATPQNISLKGGFSDKINSHFCNFCDVTIKTPELRWNQGRTQRGQMRVKVLVSTSSWRGPWHGDSPWSCLASTRKNHWVNATWHVSSSNPSCGNESLKASVPLMQTPRCNIVLPTPAPSPEIHYYNC